LVPNLKSAANYEFLIDWPRGPGSGSVQWAQVENPLTLANSQTPTMSGLVESPASQTSDVGGTFQGLAESANGSAALNGDSKNAQGYWWWAIGTNGNFGNGIPGYYSPGGSSGTPRTRLWVR
jgi:hypothetical protein